MRTQIIADSRGAHLEPILRDLQGIGETRVSVNPGKTISGSVEVARNHVKDMKPDLIIVMSGICSITNRDRHTKVISLRHTDINTVVDTVMTDIDHAHKLIRETSDAPVSFATVTGADLTDVNNQRRRIMSNVEYQEYVLNIKVTHPDQATLNTAIIRLNRRITAYNENTNTPTTWMAEIVHPLLRGQHRFYYGKLADGCHPNNNTRKRWAHQIARTIRRMTAKIDIHS